MGLGNCTTCILVHQPYVSQIDPTLWDPWDFLSKENMNQTLDTELEFLIIWEYQWLEMLLLLAAILTTAPFPVTTVHLLPIEAGEVVQTLPVEPTNTLDTGISCGEKPMTKN